MNSFFFAAEGRYKKIWSDLLSEGFKSNNSKELFDQLIRDWKISSLDVLSIDRYSNNIFVIVRVSEEVKRVKYISFQNLIFNISEDEIFLETFPFMASQGLFRQPFCFYGDLWKR